MRRFRHLDNLELYETPKQHVARYFWNALCVVVSAAIAWDAAAYLIGFWDSGAISKMIVAVAMVLLLAWLAWLAFRARNFWWATVPMIVAVAIPVVLRVVNA